MIVVLSVGHGYNVVLLGVLQTSTLHQLVYACNIKNNKYLSKNIVIDENLNILQISILLLTNTTLVV